MRVKKRNNVYRVAGIALLGLGLASLAMAQGRGAVQVLKSGQMIDPLRAPGGPQSLVQRITAPVVFEELLGLDMTTLGDICTGTPHAIEGLRCPSQIGGLEHVAAGIGLRHRDAGVITLRGAPQGASPVAAYLYLGLIGPAHQPPPSLSLEGAPLETQLVGSTESPCWLDSASRFFLFRASVSHLLHQDINGEYSLAGVPSSRGIGDDPWGQETLSLPLAEGASLVVIYTHPTIPQSSRVMIHEGPAALRTHLVVDNPISLPPQVVQKFRHTRIGGDGQRDLDYSLTSRFGTILGDGEGEWFYLRGPGSPVDPSSDWQGLDGGAFTQLWDTQTNDVSLGGAANYSESGFYEVMYFASDGLVGGSICAPPPIPEPRTFEPAFVDTTLVDCVAVAVHVLTTQ